MLALSSHTELHWVTVGFLVGRVSRETLSITTYQQRTTQVVQGRG